MAKKPFSIPKLTTYEDILGLNTGSDAKEEVVYIPYDYLHRSPYQYRDWGRTNEQIQEQVESLAFDIEVDGRIQQPCIVRETIPGKTDDYEIVAGHHRILAAKYLTEVKKLDGFKEVPCLVRELSDAQAEYLCNSSNNLRPKTDYQIMHELETKMRLLKEHPEEFPHLTGPGRMVDKLAKEMNLSKSTVGEYLQISKNLSKDAMESFESGQLNKSAAVTLSSLSHEEQDRLIGAGVTKQKEIKAYKNKSTTITDTVRTVKSTDDSSRTSVPNFGRDVHEDDGLNFGSDVIIEDIVPDFDSDYTEQEELRRSNEEIKRAIEAWVDVIIEDIVPDFDSRRAIEAWAKEDLPQSGKCDSGRCRGYTDIANTFVFCGRRYCTDCLYELIMDLADAGVITLDTSAMESKGIAIHA